MLPPVLYSTTAFSGRWVQKLACVRMGFIVVDVNSGKLISYCLIELKFYWKIGV
jgi:hypothetical protein